MIASSDRLLRHTLWANAILSVGSGALLAALATPFAKMATHAPLQVLGLDLAIVLEVLGLGFVAFGAVCGWVASRPEMPLGWARAIFILDASWVAISAVILMLPASWTVAGIAGIVVVALIVADLAIFEYLGLRRINAAN
ncbi:MAG: hypothetical protein FD144_4917 [Rhodospirillaceae bacterium]|nr:MAG: hypothetical protein FD144_4917 [Rhodospirillaceae bacterium]